jgi:hypothetical protein
LEDDCKMLNKMAEPKVILKEGETPRDKEEK